jgi:foldase protein PrsA
VAKRRRQAKIPTPAWERPRGTIGSRVLGRGPQFYGAVGAVLVILLVLGIVVFALGSEELEKRGRPGSTAVQVEDTRFRLDYFASRVTMFLNQNGGQATDVQQRAGVLAAVSDIVIMEEIVRRFAGELDVAATEEEILEEIASRLGITSDDESFDLVFQQELARTGISEPDYRQMMEAAVLESKLRDEFLAQVPDSVESVRYRQIVVSEQERADELVAEIESGGDFAALAAEDFNLDVANKENGGELGWVPRGVLDASTEELVFSLEPGKTITIPTVSGVVVIEMLEKDNERPVEEGQEEVLAGRLLDDWVAEKMEPLSIVNNMDLTDGDPDKINWAVDSARG